VKRLRSNEYTLRSAIEEFLKTFRLEDKLNESGVIQSWEKVVGEMVARHTKKLSIRNKILFVSVDSSALRNELLFSKETIIASLNHEAGHPVIEDMVLR
jgi:predicted nucleic acid-binding Zn ribbon protein